MHEQNLMTPKEDRVCSSDTSKTVALERTENLKIGASSWELNYSYFIVFMYVWCHHLCRVKASSVRSTTTHTCRNNVCTSENRNEEHAEEWVRCHFKVKQQTCCEQLWKLPHYFQQRFVYLRAHVWSKIGAESLCDELCVTVCSCKCLWRHLSTRRG